ncbi:hypothetical protein M3Y95_01027400 [Aphelenchoides besseyi]|nr:hypothetical protein M3Y95_01027400 [Aphelenchoides besseyi]
MFRFFGLGIFLVLFVGVEAYGNSECIRNIKLANFTGFGFKYCSAAAEVSMKWKQEHAMGMLVINDTELIAEQHFKVVVNNNCTFNFMSKKGGGYAEWKIGDSVVVNCTDIADCMLGSGDSSIDNSTASCTNALNEIDDTWAWSKFRVENLPSEFRFHVFVLYPDDEGEGTEYVVSSSTETISTKLEVSIALLIALMILVL